MKKSFRAAVILALAIFIMDGALTAFAQRARNRPAAQNRRVQILNNPQAGQGRARPNRRNLPAGPGRRQQIQRQLMQALGLSADQRQRMAEIRQNNEENIIEAGRTLRQARQALDRAIRDENYNERIISQHIEELATAQAEMTRQQARVRAQLRGVLTAEQMIRLNRLERQYRQRLRQERERQQGSGPQRDGPQGALTPFDLPPHQSEEPDLISFLVFGN